ncbi:MAG: hypothetical protein ACYC09_14260 [Bacteroidota bacterium]
MKYTILVILSLFFFASCELDQSVTLDRTPSPPGLDSASVTPVFINIGGNASLTSFDTSITIRASLDRPYSSSVQVIYSIFSPNGDLFTSGTIADNGIDPDLASADGHYAVRRTITIPTEMIGTFTVQVAALNASLEYSSIVNLPVAVFNLNNTPPLLSGLSAPDTVIVPTGSDINFVKVSITAADSQGLNDIVSVSLKSLRPDSSVAGLFPLYDDGGTTVRPTFNISSGDSIANDGRYTLVIPIFSSTQNNTFRDFIFTATDRSNALSAAIIKRVYIQ